jgi:Uma2 family endonuclease
MSTLTRSAITGQIIYPESDGKPMAENTLQFEWIVTIKEGLADLFRDRPDVFVAGDLLWYPVEGDPKTCTAPDTMVTIGRPNGHRGSYKQWEEGNLPPQVVFEILSPGNTHREMIRKSYFYERFGVEEYYVFDPDSIPQKLDGWRRIEPDGPFQEIQNLDDWISPRLGIRFDLSGDVMKIYRPDGRRFLTYSELSRFADKAVQNAEDADQRAETAMQQAETATRRADQLAAKLRAMGIDPDA